VQITVNITGAVTKKEFEKVLKQLGQAAPEVGGFRKKKGGALFCRSVERERSKDDVPRGRMIERSAQQPTHRAPHTHTPPVWRTFTVFSMTGLQRQRDCPHWVVGQRLLVSDESRFAAQRCLAL